MPRGIKYPDDNYIIIDSHISDNKIFIEYESEQYSLRDLVSIESGLWQFVVDKKLFDYKKMWSGI